MIIHDFKTQLKYSLEKGEDTLFDFFYHRTFPNLSVITFAEDLTIQKKGIDKILRFQNGAEIYIDEKKRKEIYPDILLEVWSVWEQRKRGWLYTSQSDYIVYAVMPLMKVYLLPTLLLKKAWNTNQKEWLKKYPRWIEAKNKGYVTKSKAIPTDILLSAITNEMQINIIEKEATIKKEESSNQIR